MVNKKTLKYVRDKFIDIEEKFEVYSIKVDDVYFWKLIRFELFNDIVRKLNILNEGHPTSGRLKCKRFFLLIKYSLLNAFKRKNVRKRDFLILTHGRKQKCGEKFVDIYLNDILEAIREKGKSVLVIDRPDHYGRHYGDYGDMIYFERVGHIIREGFYRIFPFKIDLPETEEKLKDIENELNKEFGVFVNLKKMVKKRVFRFKFEKKYFDKLLDSVSPQKVFLVVSYGKEELIASARERGIEVVEVQHGVIDNYHMGYYFPFAIPIPYFPDKLVLFGEYWKQSVKFPVNSRQIVKHFGFAKRYRVLAEKVEKKNKILFVSQGSIGSLLSKVAVNFVNNNQVECYYKLHPSEFDQWRSRYRELSKCETNGKIKVISDQKSLYDLFEQCRYVIGVYSTAIYESLMCGCKTFIIKIEGYQYMEYLIENGYVKLLPPNFCIHDLYNFKGNKLKSKDWFYA